MQKKAKTKDPLQDQGNTERKQLAKQRRRDPDRPFNQMMPYLLLVLAIFFFICLWIPEKRTMGAFGVWMTRSFYVVFGRACILIPVLLCNIALFWRRDRANGQLVWKIAVSLAILVVVASLTQLAYAQPRFSKLQFSQMYERACLEYGAGFFGLLFGNLLYQALGNLGTRLISTLLLLIFIPFLFGTTPWRLANTLYQIYRTWQQKRAQKAQEAPATQQEEPIARPQKPAESVGAPVPPAPAPATPSTYLPKEAVENALRQSAPNRGQAPHAQESVASAPEQGYFSRNRFAPTSASDLAPEWKASANTPSARYGAEGVVEERRRRAAAPTATPYVAEPAPEVPDVRVRAGQYSVPKMEPMAQKEQNNWVEVKSRDRFAPTSASNLPPDTPRSDTISHVRTVQLPPYEEPKAEPVLQTERTVVDVGREETDSVPPTQTVPLAKESTQAPVDPLPQESIAPDVQQTTQASVPAAEPPVQEVVADAEQADTEDLATIMRQMLSPEMMEKIDGGRSQTQTLTPQHTVAEPKKQTPSALEQEIYGKPVQEKEEPKAEYFDRPTPAQRASEPKSAPVPPPPPPPIPYQFPPSTLLRYYDPPDQGNIKEELEQNAARLVKALQNFRVGVSVTDVSRGPTITRYELLPDEGVRVASISRLSDDIALALAAPSIRIEAPIPGKQAVGVEVPNRVIATVALRDLVENERFLRSQEPLFCALGMDVAGEPIFINLAKMPHLLIAGATGSGKSVCINSLIISILMHASPDEVKLILIDPKKVEFSPYNGIPHLLIPTVTDPRKAAGALRWATVEMDRRYQLLEQYGVQKLEEYNQLRQKDSSMEKLPMIVIIIDELADLMQTASDDVEGAIARLTQLARAAGMHMIIGTQRPSVDVITGKIKSNVPSRIAFAVSSQIDSRTILDAAGAEKLLGKGDMLYSPTGSLKPTRVQGAFVDSERKEIIAYVKKYSQAVYDSNVIAEVDRAAEEMDRSRKKDSMPMEEGNGTEISEDEIAMLKECALIAVTEGKISASFLQLKLKIGFQKAKRMICYMEQMGIIGEADGQKPRDVLLSESEYQELLQNDDAWSGVQI